MSTQGLECSAERRRNALFREWEQEREKRINGVDFVEVLPEQKALCVHFFGDVPALRDDDHPDGLGSENLVIRGGRRIRDMQIVGLRTETSSDPDRDDCLHVSVDRLGDFSTYQFCVVGFPGIDPLYACADFSFRVDCPSDLDCAVPEEGPTPSAEPEISYLAKDYASFRRLILDRLAVTMPDWRERHEADLGIALVELLAYAGDHLSYYQDAVATEAYLSTARQRISVRRHATLVDYALHQGLNARAWITVHTDANTHAVRASDLYFITGFPGLRASTGKLLPAEDLEGVPESRYLVFEPVTDTPDDELTFYAAHSEIKLYTWGNDECRLAAGATAATLLDTDPALRLDAGDVIIFEEVKGPETGEQADADPDRRHAVRLTRATTGYDELLKTAIVDIEWAAEDALPFPLWVSTRRPAPDCTPVRDVTVARGNVVLVDHGRTVGEPLGTVGRVGTVGDCACEGSVLELTEIPARYGPVLVQAPLTYADPVDPAAPATAVLDRDPHDGRPQVSLRATTRDGVTRRWTPEPDMLSSAADAAHFVAETDDDGRAHLRFGDGRLGGRPEAGTTFQASYRIGNGAAGNVGRDAISFLVLRNELWSGPVVRPRNPLAASGGVDMEPIAQAKLLAPDAFRAELKRAVTADDYAQLAARHRGLQSAAAELSWAGSWYEARVAVDVAGTDLADSSLLAGVGRSLQPYRRMGHDLDVVAARTVPLDIELHVCVEPQHSRGAVKAAVLDVLGSRRRSDGGLGMFHPDNLTFGSGIHLSHIVAAVQSLDGVSSVEVTRLRRLGERDAGELQSGVLPIGNLEVAQLAADPSIPEHGRLVVVMGGGR